MAEPSTTAQQLPQDSSRLPTMHEYHEQEFTREPSVENKTNKDRDWEGDQASNYTVSSGATEEGDQTSDYAVSISETINEDQRYSVFGIHHKRYIVFLAGFASLFSTLAANTYLPALNTLAQELHVTDELINLTLTSYMIFQGLAPTFYGDLADMTGRRPTYILGFAIFVAANIGLALQTNYAALFLLRCLQSTGSSGTIALGNGVVADVSVMAERGTYMGFVIGVRMVGPAIGPIIGGVLSELLGWRSIFWFLAILSAVFLMLLITTFPETARSIVGNGSLPPQPWNMSLFNYLKWRKTARDVEKAGQTMDHFQPTEAQRAQRRLRWPNPLRSMRIIWEKDVAIILCYNALVYTAYYQVTTSLPRLFAEIYGFNDLEIGLAFLPYGVGCVVASILCGRVMDLNYNRVAKATSFGVDRSKGDELKNFPIEKARLQVIWPLLICGIGAMIGYGWVLQYQLHFAAPLVFQFLIGLCLVGAYDVTGVMLVDLYPDNPATATAANNLVRCLLGAAGTGLINRMIDGMGRGWCFTFIAMVLVLASPMLLVEQKWGAGWREARRARVQNVQSIGG